MRQFSNGHRSILCYAFLAYHTPNGYYFLLVSSQKHLVTRHDNSGRQVEVEQIDIG